MGIDCSLNLMFEEKGKKKKCCCVDCSLNLIPNRFFVQIYVQCLMFLYEIE